MSEYNTPPPQRSGCQPATLALILFWFIVAALIWG